MQQNAHPLTRSDPGCDQVCEFVGALVKLTVGQPLGFVLQGYRVRYGITTCLEVPVQTSLPLSSNGTTGGLLTNDTNRASGQVDQMGHNAQETRRFGEIATK